MRHRIVAAVVIPMGVLLSAGAILAQTAGPSVGPPSSSIIPVTGPSTGPGPLEPVKPELVSVPQGTTGKVEPGGKGVARAKASGQGAQEVKAAQKPGSKTVVKKASAPCSTVDAGPAKTTHVAKAKPRTPAAQTVAGKPLHPAKRQPPAPTVKDTAPAPAVLPRV